MGGTGELPTGFNAAEAGLAVDGETRYLQKLLRPRHKSRAVLFGFLAVVPREARRAESKLMIFPRQ